MKKISDRKQVDGLALLSEYRSALMGFAALLIIYFHEWIRLFDGSTALGITENFIKVRGFVGVDIFLLLSGMGLVYSIQNNSTLTFYYKRFKRIILPFLAMAIVRAVMEKWEFDSFIKNVTGFNFYTKSIYSFLWFVPAISTLYILFPLFYKSFSEAQSKNFFIFFILELWLIYSLLVRETQRNDMFGFTNRIPIFIIGVYIGWLIKNKKTEFTRSTWLFIIAMLFLGGLLSYLNKNKGMYVLVPVGDCCFPNILMSISLSLLLAKGLNILAGYEGLCIIEKVIKKVLSFFGKFSLEFYCVQEWLGGRIIKSMSGNYPNIVINLTVLVCVTIIAYSANSVFSFFWDKIEACFDKANSKSKGSVD